MGLFSSLVSGIFGIGAAAKQSSTNLEAQREANETNLQIAQMNNEYNKEMFDKQMAYNYDMWDKQSAFSEQMADKSNAFQKEMWQLNNEYNTASAQASRLREAGLNPYMMMNGGDAGSASFSGGSMASTPGVQGVTPPRAESVRVNPVLDDGSMYRGIQDMITNVMNIRRTSAEMQLIDEQSRNIGIENQYKAMQIMTDLSNKIENTRNTYLKNFYQKLYNSRAGELLQNEVNKGRQEYAIGQMQEQLMATDYAMKQIQLASMPYQIQLGISREIAQIGLISAQKGYTEEQTRKAVQEKLESFQRTEGIKLSNKEREQCMSAAVRLAKARATHAENNIGSDNPWSFFSTDWEERQKRWFTGSNF